FNYHAVPSNIASLRNFRFEVSKLWLRVIRRRSQRSRITRELMDQFVAQWLPLPKILHPYPHLRFDAKHPREEPRAEKLLARICAGGAGQLASLPRPKTRANVQEPDLRRERQASGPMVAKPISIKDAK